jgi:hypothetical protein
MLVHGKPATIRLPHEHDRLLLVQDVFGGTGLDPCLHSVSDDGRVAPNLDAGVLAAAGPHLETVLRNPTVPQGAVVGDRVQAAFARVEHERAVRMESREVVIQTTVTERAHDRGDRIKYILLVPPDHEAVQTKSRGISDQIMAFSACCSLDPTRCRDGSNTLCLRLTRLVSP